MAAVVNRKNGTREVRVWIAKGKRRSLYVGTMALRDAVSFGKSLDKLAECVREGTTPGLVLGEWIHALSDSHHAKLAEWGLVKSRILPEDRPDAMTIGRWIDKCIEKGHRKESTKEQLQIAGKNLKACFGPDKLVCAFNAGDAEDFRNWLLREGRAERKAPKKQPTPKKAATPKVKPPSGLALNTMRRRVGRAKEFFAAAVRHKIITSNPFADEASAVGANVERQVFVPAEWIERCIKAAPCEDWRIIIALARYAGMRSHETRLQRWDDIDIANARMIVRSEKNPPTRVCPIFPELMPHIRRAKEFAPPGAEFVQTRYKPSANIGTTFTKIIERAGLVPWQRLFQNLRATRETELMASYPAKDVSSWLGNSAPVAMKHYAMAMQDSFDRAIRDGASVVVKAGVTCHPDLQNPAGQEDTREDQNAASQIENAAKDVLRTLVTFYDVSGSYPARTRT